MNKKKNSIKSNLVNRFMSTPNVPEILGYIGFLALCFLCAYVGTGHHPH